MKRTVLSLMSIALLSSGCASTGANSKTGAGFYANFKESQFATSSGPAAKKGMACSENIVGIAVGDSSIEAAKKDGGITTVSSVDSEYKNILFVYGKHCTIVRGN